jgi:lipopolysaccharide export system permease protein
MSRFDRYLLGQFLTLFGFFSLVLVLVYWVNRAVGLFDRLIGDGQTALVFLELSLLTIPNVVRLVLPVSAFAAVVYVTNRLMQDGELVVMQATGFSAFRLARPVLWFGLLVALMLSVLAHLVVPASRATLVQRQAEIDANVTARLLSDGQFMHPVDGISFFIREISPEGELRDVFLADDRSASTRTSYTARRAYLVRGETGPKLVMLDGQGQTLDRRTQRLSVTHFADFTYDIGTALTGRVAPRRSMDALSTADLLAADPEQVAAMRSSRAEFLSDGHSRIASPFLAVAAAMIGFGALLLGTFSRFGLWRQILFAVVLLILVQMADNAATGAALRDDRLWWAGYLSPLLGIGMGVAMLAWSQRPRRVAGLAWGASA